MGDEMGGYLETAITVALIGMGVVLVPLLLLKAFTSLTHPPSRGSEVEVLSQLPKNTQELVKELAAVQGKTQSLLSKLESEAKSAEELVQAKKNSLNDLQRKIDLLKLTPEQRQIVEQYNKSVSSDIELREWLSRRTTFYSLAENMLVSTIFFFVGAWWAKRAQRRATPTKLSTEGARAEPTGSKPS